MEISEMSEVDFDDDVNELDRHETQITFVQVAQLGQSWESMFVGNITYYVELL